MINMRPMQATQGPNPAAAGKYMGNMMQRQAVLAKFKQATGSVAGRQQPTQVRMAPTYNASLGKGPSRPTFGGVPGHKGASKNAGFRPGGGAQPKAIAKTPKAPSFPPNSGAGGPVARTASSGASTKGPIEHRDPEEIKGEQKMRKVQAMTNKLLDEWASLTEARKEDSITVVAEKFAKRVPGKYLSMLAEKFYDAIANEDLTAVSDSAATSSAEKRPAPAAMKEATPPAKKLKQELPAKSPVANSTVTRSVAAPAMTFTVQDPVRFQQAMNDVLQAEPKDWQTVWASQKIATKDQASALAALGQGAAEAGDIESVCTLLTTLAGVKLINMSAIEAALAALAGNLEELVLVYENAWHLHSQSLYHFFPRTDQSSWGFPEKTWTWNGWWQMVERVLSNADSFRAFDILVLVLQMMQESSGLDIKMQPVWQESGRLEKVRKVLCKWGDMDDKAIMETLSAYGVEL